MTIFRNIDSEEKAYWLGFISCDGSVLKNRLSFSLSIKSHDHLKRLINFLNTKDTSTIYNAKCKDKLYPSVKFIYRNDDLIEDLKNLNITGKKIERESFPLLDEQYRIAFLAGCYDADGDTSSNDICSGNIKFLEWLKQTYNIPFEIKAKINKKTNKIYVYTLCISADIRTKLCNISLFQKRKKVVYKKKPAIKNIKKELTEEQKTYIKQNINVNNLESISKQINCSIEKIKKFCNQEQIKILSPQEKAILKEKIHLDYDTLKKHLEDGLAYTTIGKMYGVSDNAIKKRAIRFKLNISSKFSHNKS